MLPVDKVTGDRYNYTYNELGYTFVYSYDEAGNILSKSSSFTQVFIEGTEQFWFYKG